VPDTSSPPVAPRSGGQPAPHRLGPSLLTPTCRLETRGGPTQPRCALRNAFLADGHDGHDPWTQPRAAGPPEAPRRVDARSRSARLGRLDTLAALRLWPTPGSKDLPRRLQLRLLAAEITKTDTSRRNSTTKPKSTLEQGPTWSAAMPRTGSAVAADGARRSGHCLTIISAHGSRATQPGGRSSWARCQPRGEVDSRRSRVRRRGRCARPGSGRPAKSRTSGLATDVGSGQSDLSGASAGSLRAISRTSAAAFRR
jgi:hypothetical protein